MNDAFSSLPDSSRGAGTPTQDFSEVLAPPLPDLGPATGAPAGAGAFLAAAVCAGSNDGMTSMAAKAAVAKNLRMYPLKKLILFRPGLDYLLPG